MPLKAASLNIANKQQTLQNTRSDALLIFVNGASQSSVIKDLDPAVKNVVNQFHSSKEIKAGEGFKVKG